MAKKQALSMGMAIVMAIIAAGIAVAATALGWLDSLLGLFGSSDNDGMVSRPDTSGGTGGGGGGGVGGAIKEFITAGDDGKVFGIFKVKPK